MQRLVLVETLHATSLLKPILLHFKFLIVQGRAIGRYYYNKGVIARLMAGITMAYKIIV